MSNGNEEIVLVNSYRELELAVGDTIIVESRRLTLLDIEGKVGLFHLDADDRYVPVSGEEIYELLTVGSDGRGAPR